jgi:hypothetical protein
MERAALLPLTLGSKSAAAERCRSQFLPPSASGSLHFAGYRAKGNLMLTTLCVLCDNLMNLHVDSQPEELVGWTVRRGQVAGAKPVFAFRAIVRERVVGRRPMSVTGLRNVRGTDIFLSSFKGIHS